MRLFSQVGLALVAITCSAAQPENLLTNGGFQFGLNGWRPLWCRQPGAGTLSLQPAAGRSDSICARIQHRGSQDWSFEPELRVPVKPGEVYELEVWVKLQGEGSITLCASTWDAQAQNVSWSLGERTSRASAAWKRLRTRLVVPPGVAQLQPRLIGSGAATVLIDDFSVKRLADFGALAQAQLPEPLALTNAALIVTAHPRDATFSVLDRRTGREWKQQALAPEVVVTAAKGRSNRIELELLDIPSDLKLHAVWELERAKPELTLTLSGRGDLESPLRYPPPFATEAGDDLIVPMNEGISYPVEDPAVEQFRLVAYGGHGICMAFWGVTHGGEGQEALIETPDDAAIKFLRLNGRLAVAPEWDSQKGQFGYARRLRYIFFAEGGYVAMAKRYRGYIESLGRLKTLAEKRRQNPAVDLLVGAVNVWNWDSDPVALVKEMQSAGIHRILWSRGGSPEALRALNQMRVLTSRYDIYQDVMDPANFPLLKWTHPDWTTAAWPDDIIVRADGNWQRGWAVEGKNGGWYDCGVLCDRFAPAFARGRLGAELKTHPYRCRFIDTTTAAPWNECYNTNHPMTRSQSREWKMKLLDCVSRQFNLVTGSETGHDAAVPFVDYFEGMLSLGPYRVPDAGRDMQRIWPHAPERVVKFQLGHRYRLPLWELVYHDCVVAQWYWGDYSNKLPALWDKRDLFNALYGTPPMFMFNHQLWESQKGRFVQSYQKTCPIARATAYSEMTNHCFLTTDRDVQQTAFANGVVVTVNFGSTARLLASGELLKPGELKVQGLPPGE